MSATRPLARTRVNQGVGVNGFEKNVCASATDKKACADAPVSLILRRHLWAQKKTFF